MAGQPTRRLSDLSQVIWREREALELVVFKLHEQRLLLEDGQDRWVCHASQELEEVLDRLSGLELTRAVAAAAAAAELGIEESAGLRALAAAAPAPWPSVLQRHVKALVRIVGEIVDLATGNRTMLDARLAEVRKAMGAGARRATTRMLVDAAAYTAALATNDRVLQPSLVDTITG